ncbi:MAG: GNAT family N-acetyltransferase, partial [Pirellulales bacterium]
MPRLDFVVSCPVRPSFAVAQVAGMFDVPLAERLTERFSLDVPDWIAPQARQPDWRIGLIVGPSGSGKTTIARQLFGAALVEPVPWPTDRAVIDAFAHLPTTRATGLLTAVGLGSAPAWIKPYHVLSGGERFRCDLARALAAHCDDEQATVVCDEFTSVVDRRAAQLASAALTRALRSNRIRCRLVAVTGHDDVAAWLEPDWVLDTRTRQFARGSLRRPRLELELYRCARRAWRMFAPHHYLSGQLSAVARPFVALCRLEPPAVSEAEPAAFCATVSIIGRRRHWRISRLVALPDYQGLGIGAAMAEAVGDWHLARGERLSVTASHRALVAHCRRSPRWRFVDQRAARKPRAAPA